MPVLYSAYDTDLWHALLNGEDCDLELQKRPSQVMLHGGKTCKKIIQMSQFPYTVGPFNMARCGWLVDVAKLLGHVHLFTHVNLQDVLLEAGPNVGVRPAGALSFPLENRVKICSPSPWNPQCLPKIRLEIPKHFLNSNKDDIHRMHQ